MISPLQMCTKTFGSPMWAPFVIRVTAGAYLFLLGSWAIEEKELLANTVQFISGLSGSALTIYVAVIPYVFILCGTLLVLGFLTTGAALVSCLVIVPLYVAANLFNTTDASLVQFGAKRQLYKDVVLLCAILSLIFSGPGPLSCDAFLRRAYQK